LDEPLPRSEARDWFTAYEPIVSKVLLSAIAVLGLLLLVLIWRGVGKNTVRSTHDAPQRTTAAVPLRDSTFGTRERSIPSQTPVAPFRVPMAESPQRGSTTHEMAPSFKPEVAEQVPANRDIPPDMPRYAPGIPQPDLAPSIAGQANRQPPARVADQRAATDPAASQPAYQPPAARLGDTIDTPPLEPTYDGTRSRLR